MKILVQSPRQGLFTHEILMRNQIWLDEENKTKGLGFARKVSLRFASKSLNSLTKGSFPYRASGNLSRKFAASI
jgi:hypothetical protein